MAVTSLDADTEFWNIVNRIKTENYKRIQMPQVFLCDGNWVLRGRAAHLYAASFTEIENETGPGKIEMPLDYYLSQWIVDHDSRPTKNVHIRVEKDGVRWCGRMWNYEIEKGNDGKEILRVNFRHDYEEFKHILVFANPFLPPEIQFPRLWLVFGSAKWALKTTLMVNIMRLESSLWQLPDNPLDGSQWFNFNQSTWSMVVAPDGPVDNSPFAIVHSRFKDFHSVQKNIAEDAQLTPTFRRWFTGDPPPWAGAVLRNGCLVIDYEDKSAWLTGTSFGGSIFTGLIFALLGIGVDGLTQQVQILPDPIFPPEYSTPGFKGTTAAVPAIIYREGEHTGIQTSLFIGSPAKDARHVTGGHSMPGVVWPC